jgi:hypothetical protein
MTPDQAYEEIKTLWKELKRSKKQLKLSSADDSEQ